MKLTLADIESCFELLADMLRSKGVEEIETGQHDFYWTVLSGDWLDFAKEPKAAVGSLDDDFAEIKKVVAGESSPSTIDFERLAAVLKLLSEELDQPTSR